MATELERLLVRIDATTEGLRREISKAEKSVSGAQNSIDRSSARISNSFKGVEQSAKRMGLALVGAFSAKAFLDAARSMQNLEARLKTVTGSTRAAEEAMSFLKATAAEQSVELSSLADGFNRLLPSVKAGRLSFNEMSSILTLANDNIKAFGLSSSEATGLFLGLSQTFGSGTVQMEDLRQITDRLPGSLDAIAAALKTDVAGLKDMVAQGTFTAEMLKGPLMEAFKLNEGAAKDLAGTFDSSMTRMKNAFAELSDAIADLGVLDAISAAVEEVGNAINFLTGIVAKFQLAMARLTGSNKDIVEATKNYENALDKFLPKQKQQLHALEALEGANLKGAESFKVLTKEEQKAAKETDKLAEKQAEYKESLLRTVEQQKALSAANDNSAEMHERLEREISAENEAREKGYKLGTKEFEQIKQLIIQREELKQGITDTTKARDEAIKKAEEEQKRWEEALMAPWENALEDIQDALADMLVNFDFTMDSMEKIGKRAAAEVAAAWVIKPAINALIGGAGGGGGGESSGGVGFGPQNLINHAGSLIGLTGAGSAISSGVAGGLLSLGSGGIPLGGFGAASSMAALAPIAIPAIAAIAIPMIIKAFSGTPTSASEFTGITGAGGTLASAKIGEKNGGTQFASAVQDAISQMLMGLAASGVNVDSGLSVRGGFNTKQAGGGFLQVGDNELIKFDKDSEESLKDALGVMVMQIAETAEVLSDEVAAALDEVAKSGGNVEEVLNAIAWAAARPQMLAAANQNNAQGILGMVDPSALARIQENQRFAAQLADLKTLKATQKEINTAMLLHQLQMQQIMQQNNQLQDSALEKEQQRLQEANSLAQRFASISGVFKNILFDIQYGKYAAGTPVSNLANLRELVQSTGARAALGDADAAEELAQLLPAFLELSGEVNGFNQDFAADRGIAENLASHTLSVAQRQVELQTRIAQASEAQVAMLQNLGASLSAGQMAQVTAAAGGSVISGSGLSKDVHQQIGRLAGYTGDFGGGAESAFAAENAAYRARFDNLAVQAGGKVRFGYATGGLVNTGISGIDAVPAGLTDGEFVMRQNAVASIGAARMAQMNATGRLANDNTGVEQRLDILVRTVGQLAKVTAASGNMTTAQLAEVNGTLGSIRRDAALVAAG